MMESRSGSVQFHHLPIDKPSKQAFAGDNLFLKAAVGSAVQHQFTTDSNTQSVTQVFLLRFNLLELQEHESRLLPGFA